MMKYQHKPDATGQAVIALPAPRLHLQQLMHRLFETVILWTDRGSQRRALAELDDRLLKDVGISRSEAWNEVAKPFWH